MAYDYPVRAFLCHSSADQALVREVHKGLRPGSTWLDHAEIEWGQRFLDAIEEGIQSASDFVLFWSASAA